MLELVFLALALGMDAFAVSIALGARGGARGMALKAGTYFGCFQALMPLAGWLGGKTLLGGLHGHAHWIAFVLLSGIGLKMLYEAWRGNPETILTTTSGSTLFGLAVATSIDALAAGFTLPLLPVNAYAACALIGLVTFVLGVLGVSIGRHGGTWLESKAEVFGGLVLILLGFRLLLA
jgi:putative Mn2+ efflux pump MntP